MWSTDMQVREGHQLIQLSLLVLPTSEQWKTASTLALWPESLEARLALSRGLLLEWILQNMVRHFVTHKQVQADKRHPI